MCMKKHPVQVIYLTSLMNIYLIEITILKFVFKSGAIVSAKSVLYANWEFDPMKFLCFKLY